MSTSHNGHAAFTAESFGAWPVYETFTVDDPDVTEGLLQKPLVFTIQINPTVGELKAQQALWPERFGENQWAGIRAYNEFIAHRVKSWNIRLPLKDHEEQIVDVPPPAEIGATVFNVIPPAVMNRICTTCHIAHQGGDVRKNFFARPAPSASGLDSPKPTSEPVALNPDGESRQPRRRSS